MGGDVGRERIDLAFSDPISYHQFRYRRTPVKILLRHGKAIAALVVGLAFATFGGGCVEVSPNEPTTLGFSRRLWERATNRDRYLGSIDKLGPAVTDGEALYLTLSYTRSPNWHVVRIDPRDGSSAFVSRVPAGCRPVERKVVKDEESRPERKTGGCVCVWSDGSAHPFFAPRVRCLGIGGTGERVINLPAYGIDLGAATLAIFLLPPASAMEAVWTGTGLFFDSVAGAGS